MKKRLLSLLLVFVLVLSMVPVVANADDTLPLTVTYFDFYVGSDLGFTPNPDFQNVLGNDTGKVATVLTQKNSSEEKIPNLKSDITYTTIHSDASFKQWYQETTDINTKYTGSLDFKKEGNYYVFDSNSFFPLDAHKDLLGNAGYKNDLGVAHNYHFTMALHTKFTYNPAFVDFTFRGDDDVYVFIDNKLVLDLGGVHSPQDGNIDVETLGLVSGKTYDFDLYFAERHTTQSNIIIKTNLPLKATEYTLTTKVEDSDGETITNNIPEISPSIGTHNYISGEEVSLTAGNNAFYTFSHWDIDDGSNNYIAPLEMFSNKTATAVYEIATVEFNKYNLIFRNDDGVYLDSEHASSGVEFTLTGPVEAMSDETGSVATAFTDEHGTVVFPLSGEGYYLLEETNHPELSDIPNGYWIYVNESGMVSEAIHNEGPQPLSIVVNDRPGYNRSVYNLQLPDFKFSKHVGLATSAIPSEKVLNPVTSGTDVKYLLKAQNDTDMDFTFYVTDGYTPATTVDIVNGIPLVGEWTTDYLKTAGNAGTYTNTASLYIDFMLSPMRSIEVSNSLASDIFEIPSGNYYLERGFRGIDLEKYLVATSTATIVVPSSRNPVPTPTFKDLTISITGEGTVNPAPGVHTYSTNTSVVMNAPVAAEGWSFLRWEGTHGGEVVNNTISMNTNKQITAVFVEDVEPVVPVVPEAEAPPVTPEAEAPPVTPEPSEDTTDEVIETPVEVPQAEPELPKTSGLPLSLLFGFGSLLTAGGFALKFKK